MYYRYSEVDKEMVCNVKDFWWTRCEAEGNRGFYFEKCVCAHARGRNVVFEERERVLFLRVCVCAHANERVPRRNPFFMFRFCHGDVAIE